MSRVRLNPEFWKELDGLVLGSRIIIDRPMHSRHPAYPQIIYPLDYGYLDGTTSSDGEGIDVWLGSRAERKLSAVLINVDSVKKDSEIKLLLGCTEAEADIIYDFYNKYPNLRGLLVFREEDE